MPYLFDKNHHLKFGLKLNKLPVTPLLHRAQLVTFIKLYFLSGFLIYFNVIQEQIASERNAPLNQPTHPKGWDRAQDLHDGKCVGFMSPARKTLFSKYFYVIRNVTLLQ
jgi:hypothetical protein